MIYNPQSLNSYFSELRDSTSHPTYYSFDNYLGKICDVVETPMRALNYFSNLDYKTSLISFIAMSILAIPAFLGQGISQIIYFVKGEKIKKEDYNAHFDEWMKKDYYGDPQQHVKHFIDMCIKNRIKAQDCPYNIIISKLKCTNNDPVYLFESDGCAGNVKLEKGDKVLVIWSSYIYRVEQDFKKFACEKLKIHAYTLNTEQFRNFFKKFIPHERTVTSGYIDQCSFIFYNSYSMPSRATVGSWKEEFVKG